MSPTDSRSATLCEQARIAIAAGPELLSPTHPDAIKFGKKRETARDFAERVALLAVSGIDPVSARSASNSICPKCKGSGEAGAMTQGQGPDDYEVSVQCLECKGTGEIQSATVGEDEIKRFRIGDILFNDEQAKMFCDLAQKGLRAEAAPARLDAILYEIDEFLEDQQDVRDGADGVQLPNKAMSLLQELRDTRTKSAIGRTSVPDDLWDDIYEFIKNHVDVVDGAYGEPRPNKAMSLMSRIDEELP